MFFLDTKLKKIQDSLYLEKHISSQTIAVKDWLLAFSCGADSICVLLFLLQMHREYNKKRYLYIVYVNHLDPETLVSKKDYLEFTTQLRKVLDDLKEDNNLLVTFIEKKRDIPRLLKKFKGSFEYRASNIRHRIIFNLARKYNYPIIFYGHTLSDWYETCIMRLNRGASSRGLRPHDFLEKLNEYLICRPLYLTTRQEVRELCKRLNFPYWNDPSNQYDFILRNKVRKTFEVLNSSGIRRTALNLLSESREVKKEENYWLIRSISPFLSEKHQQKEYHFEYQKYQTMSSEEQKKLLIYLLYKVKLYPLSRGALQHLSKIPFYYKNFSITIENWSYKIYLVVRRGDMLHIYHEKRIEVNKPNNLYITADNITKDYKIKQTYGHKSVKKILSEYKISKRQSKYIYCLLSESNSKIVETIDLSVLGLNSIYAYNTT